MRLNPTHPALSEARTIHVKARREVTESAILLKSVKDNSKLGDGNGTILKGKWFGFPLFSLTLEERATCPPSCLRWEVCYGNGMAFGHRFQSGPALERQLELEVAALSARYPRGFAVRLHILGDFYSVGYVGLWRSLLEKHPNLHVYGYSARYGCDIGRAIESLRITHPERWWIRFSRNEQSDGYNIFAAEENTVAKAITCPEQTGKVRSCLDCGLCWSVNKTIAFVDHDKLSKQRKAKKNEQAIEA